MSNSYSDAVAGAFERLRGIGYEYGPSFVNHVPMASEALAILGFADDVPSWVDANLRTHRYHDIPAAKLRLSGTDEAQWRAALGDFSRVADWTAMFGQELDVDPWPEVLARWVPRLLPGMFGALGHGAIRAAHAARAVAAQDSALGREELAHGLGYWAARWHTGGAAIDQAGALPPSEGMTESAGPVWPDFDEFIAATAGDYVRRRPIAPIPMLHAITAPAAVRLLCQYLPEEQHRSSLRAARWCALRIGRSFGAIPSAGPEITPGPVNLDDIVAAAVDLGDEHAIKLAEVARRQYERHPDERYLQASALATTLIGRQR